MIAPPLLDAIVDRALEEDLAGGDLSGEACVDAETQSHAAAVARKAVIACGAEVFRRVFTRVDPRCVVETLIPDGKEAPAGTTLPATSPSRSPGRSTRWSSFSSGWPASPSSSAG